MKRDERRIAHYGEAGPGAGTRGVCRAGLGERRGVPGANDLIKRGAKLIERAQVILDKILLQVAATLLSLELYGRVRQHPGQQYICL